MADQSEPSAALWTMAHLGTPMAVRVAATLRIGDHISAGLRTVSELAEAVHADADVLGRLMRYLATRGVLSRDESGRYSLTALGEPLCDDHPSGLCAWLDIEGIGRAELSYVQLLHSVRTGEAAYPAQFGRRLWDDLEDEPANAAAFNTAMGATTQARSRDIVEGYDWGSLGHVVDVGGGDGSLAVALLTAYPALRGTIVDQPDAARAARKALTAAELTGRCDVIEGSFFDPLPPGAGGYLLSLVIHNWDDNAARSILRGCADAAGPDGTVFVVENIGADGESPSTGMDLRMLVYHGGKERGLTEIGELAAVSGLRVAAVHPAGTLSIVELTAT